MSRVEENKERITKILREHDETWADFNTSLIKNANIIASLLIDISESLAVIADSLEEQTSQLRELDENLKVGE